MIHRRGDALHVSVCTYGNRFECCVKILEQSYEKTKEQEIDREQYDLLMAGRHCTNAREYKIKSSCKWPHFALSAINDIFHHQRITLVLKPRNIQHLLKELLQRILKCKFISSWPPHEQTHMNLFQYYARLSDHISQYTLIRASGALN